MPDPSLPSGACGDDSAGTLIVAGSAVTLWDSRITPDEWRSSHWYLAGMGNPCSRRIGRVPQETPSLLPAKGGRHMKRLILAVAGIVATALAVPANASVQINFTGTTSIPSNNDFSGQLNGLLLTQYASTGASLILSYNSIITFELLGTESGFDDRFATLSAPNLSYTEHTSLQNDFGSPIPIGSAFFSAGSLAGLLNFSAVGGLSATVGQPGFEISSHGEP